MSNINALKLGLLLVAVMPACRAGAQEPTTAPSVLEELSRQTQQTFESVRPCIIRVQVPTPQWLEQLNAINEQKRLMEKWGQQLNPDVRDLLIKQQEQTRAEIYQRVGAVVATQPAATTQAAAAPTTPNPGDMVLVAPGLVIDEMGHALVPMFIEPQAVANMSLRAAGGDGRATLARFIGSDRQTNMTIVQLESPVTKVATLAPRRPDDGSLALVFSPDGTLHLTVWSNTHPEQGLIVTPNGSVAGFGINGGFMELAASQPIAQQIIATGQVHRAILGVGVHEVGKDEILRQEIPGLGDRAALQIRTVNPGSAAQKAGLQVGDLILAIDGEPVTDTQTFAAIIATRNGKTALAVLRNSQTVQVSVQMQPR